MNSGDGTATDTSSGLLWMRCSIGQTWSNETFTGSASELTWQQAFLQADHRYEYAEQTGWRVPNMKK